MRGSIANKIIIAIITLSVIIQYGDSRTLANEVTPDKLNEAQIFVQQKLENINKNDNISQQEIKVQKQTLQSKLTCIKGIIAENSNVQNQVTCKQVVQEIANGKLERSVGEKFQNFMPMIIGGIVFIIFILSKITV